MGREKKSPAFQHYPKDILSSTRVALMTLEEEGAYRRAIDHCWLNGSLPSDPAKLAQIIGKNCSVEIATVVKEMFVVDKRNPSIILHERLEIERKKQRNFRKSRAKAGRASALKRKETKDLQTRVKSQHVLNYVDDMLQQNGQHNSTLLSPVCSLQTTLERENYKKHNSLSLVSPDGGDTGERERLFRSRYTKETCIQFAQAKFDAGHGIRSPDAFAMAIYKSGDCDDEILTWLDAGKDMKSLDQLQLERLRNRRRNAKN